MPGATDDQSTCSCMPRRPGKALSLIKLCLVVFTENRRHRIVHLKKFKIHMSILLNVLNVYILLNEYVNVYFCIHTSYY